MSNRPLIVIVDDDASTRRAMAQSLAAEGEIVECANADHALSVAEGRAPALMLIDLDLGSGPTGFALCRDVKKLPTDHPIFVMLVSGTADAETRLTGYEASADDFLPKPFDPRELLARARIHLRQRATLEHLSRMHLATETAADRLTGIVEEQARGIIVARTMTARALATLAENRDNDTGEHLDRMRDYAVAIATELQRSGPYEDLIDERFLEQLHHAAPLHDIGKVAIPDAILQKPGRLTAEEYDVMKGHAEAGSRVLEAILSLEADGGIADEASFMPMAVDIARCHHERWDGTGYPDGRAGQLIPLAARITSVADVLDALASRRCYKDAMPFEQARELILDGRGTQFDPMVLDGFERAWPELMSIRASFDHGATRARAA